VNHPVLVLFIGLAYAFFPVFPGTHTTYLSNFSEVSLVLLTPAALSADNVANAEESPSADNKPTAEESPSADGESYDNESEHIAQLAVPSAAASSVQPNAYPNIHASVRQPNVSYVLRQWTMDSGLPQSSVNDIIQTADQYLWLATFGGLVRFDGVSFTVFDRSNTPGLRSDRILGLYETSDGAIWMSTEAGFHRFYNEVATLFSFKAESRVVSPIMVRSDRAGVLWVTVDDEPYRFDGTGFVQVSVQSDSAMLARAIADQDAIWLITGRTILRTSGFDVFVYQNLSDRSTTPLVDLLEFPSGSGQYFIPTQGDGVFVERAGFWRHFMPEDGLPSRYMRSLYIDRDSTLWAISHGGVSYWSGENFVQVPEVSPTNGSHTTSMYHDAEGNFWLGTTGDGLFRARPSVVSTIGPAQGLDYTRMLSLTGLRDGRTVFATNCGGVFLWDGVRAVEAPINRYLINLCIWSVFEDSRGNVWFGSRVLYRSPSIDERGEILGESVGFSGEEVFAITEDSRGRIWIGDITGVFRYEDGQFTHYNTSTGLSENDTRVISEDASGEIWIGTTAGLHRYRSGNIEQIRLPNYFAASGDAEQPYVRTIYHDDDGTHWIGTYGSGLYRIRGDEIHQITRNDGLYDNIISHLVLDRFGYFWMGSNRGITRVSRAQLHAFADGRQRIITTNSFGAGDGMTSAETNGGFQPNVFKDASGRMYFPTINGVALVDPERMPTDANPPPVYIESLWQGPTQLASAPVVVLPYNEAFLEINYTALSYRDPGNLRFRYRLEGLSDQWYDVGTRRTALFTQIPPGEYRFQVIAANSDGVWNEVGDSLQIRVIPPFWQTAWFRILMLTMLTMVGPAVYVVRVRTLKTSAERQKRFTEQLIASQEQERRRIASELHDGLGQQILVIKNRAELARLQLEDAQLQHEQLNQIIASALSAIGDLRDISHDLRPIHLERFGLTEALRNLCEAIKETSVVEWSYHIENIDGLIASEKEINFYRVIQEATTNVQRHSGAEQASVMVSRDGGVIRVTLWDDGCGFIVRDRALFAGLGFQGMAERMQSLGGTIDVQSSPGEGTVIKLHIPPSDGK
jgi:signal transduction histidine kinase/ligand-binding sensor domain-containing protein